MGIPGHVPCNSISITSVDPINAINIRQIFALNKITQMILSNCLPNPSPSQPGKSLAIAQIQAFVIADQKHFGNMTVLLRFGSFPSPITGSCLLTTLSLSSSSRRKRTIWPESPHRMARKEKSRQSLSRSSLHYLGTQDWSLELFPPHSSRGFPPPSFFYPTQAAVCYGLGA